MWLDAYNDRLEKSILDKLVELEAAVNGLRTGGPKTGPGPDLSEIGRDDC
jgi:hypothetical protein